MHITLLVVDWLIVMAFIANRVPVDSPPCETYLPRTLIRHDLAVFSCICVHIVIVLPGEFFLVM